MNKKLLLPLLVLPLVITSCNFRDISYKTVKCENYFTLVSDFNHRYPEQDDYMNYLKSGYYETYYDNRDNGYNCHYHLEYKDGTIIDDWGNYTCDGKTFNMVYVNEGVKRPVFTLYHSPTIDFFIVDDLKINDKDYKVVYQARYLYSAKG